MPSRRVVITGLGLISPLGNSPELLWSALSQGTSGVAPLVGVPPDFLPVKVAGECREFTGAIGDFGELPPDAKKAIRKGLKMMCRETQMGVAAAQRALVDAGVQPGAIDPERMGVTFGSDYMLTEPEEYGAGMALCRDAQGRFQFERWGDEGMKQVTPLWLLKYLPNMPASHLAIYNDLRGPNNSLTMREASSLLAVGEAFRTIARDSADLLLAGATGTRIHPMKSVQTILQEELAREVDDPTSACRPFDLNRQGAVLGEGAGVLVLEELSAAERRGAVPLAEIAGCASSAVAEANSLAHRGRAIANALRGALADASVSVDQVGFVHAHGLSTRSCDREEAQAIAEVFAERCGPVPVTAAKSYFGQLGAGSGAVELIASVLALRAGRLFPILNYQTADPQCPIAAVTDHDTPSGEVAVCVSVTPQGQAAAVVIRTLASAEGAGA